MKIEDIARIAGVSKTAVSFAINNKEGISEETRQRIMKVVHDGGYISKVLVKNEETNENSKLILLLNCSRTQITSVTTGKMPFLTELISEIEQKVNEYGYSLLFRSLTGVDNLKEELQQVLECGSVAGVLLVATDLELEHVELIYQQCKNIVAMDAYFDKLDIDCVITDNYYGAFLAGSYLAKLGHKNIGYLQATSQIYNFTSRREGFVDALGEHGCSLDDKYIFEASSVIEESEHDLKSQFQKAVSLPTAFFAENDYIAIGAIKCLLKLGYKIPEDISIIGFDNIGMSTVISPELTTIDVSKEKMASLSVQRLVEKIKNNDHLNRKTFIATKLLERDSCKKFKDQG
jgi:DNA-binding LacI/PurR family transcriptional regulator